MRAASLTSLRVRKIIFSGSVHAGARMAIGDGPEVTGVAPGEDRERVLEALAGSIAGSAEPQEGLAAFGDRRAPDFGKDTP